MRPYKIPLFVILIWVSAVTTSNAHVILLTPEYGAAIAPGTTITIEWENKEEHEQLNWDLLFSPDGGVTWFELATDMPTDQFKFVWTLPDSLLKQARIQIVQDNEKLDYRDTNEFAIGDTYEFEIILGTEARLDNLEFFKVFPNPIDAGSAIEFELKRPSQVVIEVYDIMGRHGGTIINKELNAGSHSIQLATNTMDLEYFLRERVYFLHLIYGDHRKVVKLMRNSNQ